MHPITQSSVAAADKLLSSCSGTELGRPIQSPGVQREEDLVCRSGDNSGCVQVFHADQPSPRVRTGVQIAGRCRQHRPEMESPGGRRSETSDVCDSLRDRMTLSLAVTMRIPFIGQSTARIAGDQTCSAVVGEVIERPADKDNEPVLETDKIHQMDE